MSMLINKYCQLTKTSTKLSEIEILILFFSSYSMAMSTAVVVMNFLLSRLLLSNAAHICFKIFVNVPCYPLQVCLNQDAIPIFCEISGNFVIFSLPIL